MLIATEKKEQNIIEYLLYMWQIEDLLRAQSFDEDAIEKNIIEGFEQPDSTIQEIRTWYRTLARQMQDQGVDKQGHLYELKEVEERLEQLHKYLLAHEEQYADYVKTYYETLPLIVELRSKQTSEKASEISTCLFALYGYLLLRIQRKEISTQTVEAMTQISTLLSKLATVYHNKKQTA